MKLADLRKAAVRKCLRIRFSLANGLECTVDEHGVARVPGLAGVPDFNLERELESARDFRIEAAAQLEKSKTRPRSLSRSELAELVVPATAAAAADDHED